MGRKIVVCVLLAACLLIVPCTTASAAEGAVSVTDKLLFTSSGTSTGWKLEGDYYIGSAQPLYNLYNPSRAMFEEYFYTEFTSGSYSLFFKGYCDIEDKTLGFRFAYTDGTVSEYVYIDSSSEIQYSLHSDPNKVVSRIDPGYGHSNTVYLRDLILVKNIEPLSTYTNVIPSDIVDMFRDVISNESIMSSYVACCNDNNTYSLFVGDISMKGNTFVSDTFVKCYKLFPDSETSDLIYQVSDVSGLKIDASNKIVYSNLGNYPGLIRRGEIYEVVQTILIAAIGLCFIVSSIFGSCFRRK